MELVRTGHAPTLFTRFPPYFLATPPAGISCRHLYPHTPRSSHPAALVTEWPQKDLDGLKELILNVIKEEGLDILHIHYGLPFAFVALAIKEALGPLAPAVVLTLHGTDVTKLRPDSAKGNRFALTLASFSALTTVSLSHAHLFTRTWNHPRPQVIPNFTDVEPVVSRSLDSGRSRRLIHVSNFRQIKNLEGVVRIFAGIGRELATELWLVGDGDEMPRVRAAVKHFGLEKDVRFLGLMPSISSVLREADFFVMSSTYESFCLAALEAMASGLPVLAPRVGGIPEVVAHGRSGLLYPPADYDAAIHMALPVLTDASRYRKMSDAAVRQAARFEAGKVVSRYLALYRRVLKVPAPFSQKHEYRSSGSSAAGLFTPGRPGSQTGPRQK